MQTEPNAPKPSHLFARTAGIFSLLFLLLSAITPPSLSQVALPGPNGSAEQGEAPAAAEPCTACPPLPPPGATGASPPTASVNAASPAGSGPGSASAPAADATPAEADAAANVRKAPWFAPPKTPSPADAEDKQAWNWLNQAGIRVILLGEVHHDSEMIHREQNFLALSYGHGVRTVVVEYPKDKQPLLDRYLNDPSYANMSAALFAGTFESVGMKPEIKTQEVAWLAKRNEAIDANPRQAQITFKLDDDELALLQANLRMARGWLVAHRMGIAVKAGDLPFTIGLDTKTGKLITQNPTSEQVSAYALSGRGMKSRNESFAQVADASAARGRVVVIIGGIHTGYLPNEQMPGANPNETYPGLNYLLETKHHRPSVAIVQSKISPQGFLALSAALRNLSGVTPEQFNQQIGDALRKDPYRSLTDGNQPIEKSLRDSFQQRERWLQDTQPPAQEKKPE
ncbi:hypothetical protein [Methylacidimicrobium sp. B4]|uniref:hypothetical protein n=1 Tax=Methylacidimicrobium sp. B4 TaxID=2796139 RepID=UPI001A8EEF34|nr:hypothetical protein [Methylacidimicrobium sp. B4]QSR84712.1 hypothetical protein MacB4_11080 [Methylacidimicrobium sp. B4]